MCGSTYFTGFKFDLDDAQDGFQGSRNTICIFDKITLQRGVKKSMILPCSFSYSLFKAKFHILEYGSAHEKTCFWGFQKGHTKNSLLNYRDYLEN